MSKNYELQLRTLDPNRNGRSTETGTHVLI